MTIREYSRARRRNVLVVIGAMGPEVRQQFEALGYQVRNPSSAEMLQSTEFGLVDSAIFVQNPAKPTRIFDYLRLLGRQFLDHDVSIYAKVSSEPREGASREIVENAVRTLGLPAISPPSHVKSGGGNDSGTRGGIALFPGVYVCDIQLGWSDIGRLLLENRAGPPPATELGIYVFDPKGKPAALHVDAQVADERSLLVKRAFHDCVSLTLNGMDDGLSGAPAYRAYCEFAEGLHGRWPYLHFVKMGEREKIAAEYFNYQERAMGYVPFNLGPRLNISRCGLGATQGILVGDFVDGAELLRDAARSGRANGAISSLFNRTLKGWHSAAVRCTTEDLSTSLVDLFPVAIPDDRLSLISKFGAAEDVTSLRKQFLARTSSPFMIGPIHGDLHATNVLVRGSDAILIDFEKFRAAAPILYDFASLEGGLLVDSFVGDHRDPDEWFGSIRPLYAAASFTAPVVLCHPKDRSSWFYEAVSQIRMFARQFECVPGQYAVVLALSMVRKGCNKHAFTKEKLPYRAAAYAIGAAILRSEQIK